MKYCIFKKVFGEVVGYMTSYNPTVFARSMEDAKHFTLRQAQVICRKFNNRTGPRSLELWGYVEYRSLK